MASVRLKYIQEVRKRLADGTYSRNYYFRKGKFRCPMPGAPGTKEFADRYQELLKDNYTADNRQPGSMGRLIQQYRNSPEYREKAPRPY